MTWTCVLSPCLLIQVLSYILDGWKEESRKRPDAWRLRVQINSCACCARLPGLLWKQNLKRKELPLQTCLNLPMIYVGHLAMLLSGLPILSGSERQQNHERISMTNFSSDHAIWFLQLQNKFRRTFTKSQKPGFTALDFYTARFYPTTQLSLPFLRFKLALS